MSGGQILAVFVLFPFVVGWAAQYYGVDIVDLVSAVIRALIGGHL